jgi:hypothetical protein
MFVCVVFVFVLQYMLTIDAQAFVSLVCQTPTSLSASSNNNNNKTNSLHARSYPLRSLLQGMRGLDIAHETCISLNENGMIAIQHQVLDPVSTLLCASIVPVYYGSALL